MSKLSGELARLYFLPDQEWQSPEPAAEGAAPAGGLLTPALLARALDGGEAVALRLAGAAGKGRTLVVAFERAADWAPAAELWLAVQNELDLPAPAVSVSGGKGYCVWFSLAEAVTPEEARAFLEGLRRRYLAALPAESLRLGPAERAWVGLTPALVAPGKWSAFIDPELGAMFSDEPWLEMAPNPDRQADLLARLASIPGADFRHALGLLDADSAPSEAVPPPPPPAAGAPLQDGYGDPQAFLLAVMNDPSVSTRQRIAAARALMPYFHRKIDLPGR